MLATMKNEYNKLSDIERFITDGRLTEPSNGKRFEWREMIEEVKKLGRPLKEEETKKFRIKQLNIAIWRNKIIMFYYKHQQSKIWRCLFFTQL